PMRDAEEGVLESIKSTGKVHPRAHPLFWADVLLKSLKSIEARMGRAPAMPDGPRLIDIDVLMYGNVLSFGAGESGKGGRGSLSDLVLPHPRLHLRRFVLVPLCEIGPDLMHPVLKKSFRELLLGLEDGFVVRRL